MIVDKFAQELKEMMAKKNELLAKKVELQKSLRKGEDYFASLIRNPNSHALLEGAKRALEIMHQYNEIEQQVKDLDIILITKVEAYTADVIVKCMTPEHLNEAGDLLKTTEMFLVPFKTDAGLVEITPDDFWFLKLAKQALKATNVEFIPKSKED